MAWALRAAIEAHDVDAFIAELAPDVVLHSPLTSVDFGGIDEVGELYRAIFAELSAAEVQQELGDGDTRVLFVKASIAGGEVEMAQRYRLGDDGKVREITLYGRPMHRTALFARAVGPRLAAKKGARNEALVRAATRPLPDILEAMDRLGTRLTR
jgi:hypothetical protein